MFRRCSRLAVRGRILASRGFHISPSFPLEDEREFSFDTLCIHAGQDIDPETGCLTPLIAQTSTFARATPGENYPADCIYSRERNPTRTALEKMLIALEKGAEYCTVSSSGLAATTNVVAMLEEGDHMIVMHDCYGGTRELLSDIFSSKGISVEYVDMTNLDLVENALRPSTRMVWAESPTNPTLQITDLERLSDIAHSYDEEIIVVSDNTFATPMLQSPLILGADVVVHSCTKYINGHADVIMGAALTDDPDLAERIFFNNRTIGTTTAPWEAYLTMRGIKTLPHRMRVHEENAMAVAQFLEGHPKVKRVSYPGLESHPQHEIAKKQMSGFSGMVTCWLDTDSLERCEAFLMNLKVFVLAVSLGGVESLADHPVLMTHMHVPIETREELNLSDNLVRLSVGVEDISDLLWDLEQALEYI